MVIYLYNGLSAQIPVKVKWVLIMTLQTDWVQVQLPLHHAGSFAVKGGHKFAIFHFLWELLCRPRVIKERNVEDNSHILLEHGWGRKLVFCSVLMTWGKHGTNYSISTSSFFLPRWVRVELKFSMLLCWHQELGKNRVYYPDSLHLIPLCWWQMKVEAQFPTWATDHLRGVWLSVDSLHFTPLH